jgi:cytochrome P450/NADPH-cytochrome P450 reductase
VVIGSQDLMEEICNERRFRKIPAAALKQARNGVHDGLGTAYGPQEENWGVAHRILAPKLNSLAIPNMFDEMHDIASQLVMKWTRHGSDYIIEVNEDFTRLTFDTIALCTMNHRFNSFYYNESMHPFLQAMTGFLKTSGDRARRVWFTQIFYFFENRRFWSDIDLLRKSSLDIIQARKAKSTDKEDLLNSMLNGFDKKAGRKMHVSVICDGPAPWQPH